MAVSVVIFSIVLYIGEYGMESGQALIQTWTANILVVFTAIVVLAVILKFLVELRIIKSNWLGKFFAINFESKISPEFSRIKMPATKEWKLFLKIFVITIASRMAIYIFVFIFYNLKINQLQGFFGSMQFLWNKWDSNHYLFLAENWYVNAPLDKKYLLVFYPLYPLLTMVTHIFVRDYFAAGIIVSNICISVAAYFLYKLCQLEFNDKISMRAVKYMLIYPFAFFFGITYTESLFIALCIMSIYYIRRNSWGWAGFFGMLASFTRNQGLMLLVPAAVEYILTFRVVYNIRKLQIKKLIQDFIHNGIFVCIIPIGFFLYLFINKAVSGEWFRFLEYQKENWHNTMTFFGSNLKLHMDYIIMGHKNTMGIWIPQIVSFALVLVLAFYGLNKMRTSYLAFIMAYLIFSYSPSWLLSGPRYILCLFPIYMLFAKFTEKSKVLDAILTVLSIALLCFYSILFVQEGVY